MNNSLGEISRRQGLDAEEVAALMTSISGAQETSSLRSVGENVVYDEAVAQPRQEMRSSLADLLLKDQGGDVTAANEIHLMLTGRPLPMPGVVEESVSSNGNAMPPLAVSYEPYDSPCRPPNSRPMSH